MDLKNRMLKEHAGLQMSEEVELSMQNVGSK